MRVVLALTVGLKVAIAVGGVSTIDSCVVGNNVGSLVVTTRRLGALVGTTEVSSNDDIGAVAGVADSMGGGTLLILLVSSDDVSFGLENNPRCRQDEVK